MSLKQKLSIGDIVSGGLLAGVGAIGLLGGIDDQVAVVAGLGADTRTYPKILALLLLIIGLSIVIGGLRRPEGEAAQKNDAAGLLRVASVAVAAAGFAWLAPRIGFVAATVLATAAFALVAGVRRPLPILLVSIGTAVTIRVLAVELLGLTLPGLNSF